MTAWYVVAAVAGGVLLLLSLFGAHHDAEIGGDHDVGHWDHDLHGLAGWLPFFSLRFWTYALTGFGVTGWVLETFSTAHGLAVLPFALVTAALAGLVPHVALRFLRSQEATSRSTTADLVGAEAEVLVAVRPSQMGRVRASLNGDLIDVLAVCDGVDALEAGTTAVIVGVEGDRVRVVPRAIVFGELPLTHQN